ncbi:MAG: hypothetical protein AAF731_04790, partial [Bacteroidota bacterium]
RGTSFGEKTSFSDGEKEEYDYIVRPEDFHSLSNGGPQNGYRVEAYMVQTGRTFVANNSNVLKVTFRQKP